MPLLTTCPSLRRRRHRTNTISAEPLGEGPLRLGSRLREVHRGPGGKELESLVEVSEFEPDRLFALHMVEGAADRRPPAKKVMETR